MKTTFKSVNYIKTCGDQYAKWSQGSKCPIDAVLMVVTDDTGKEVYSDCVRKGGMILRTLADCKQALQSNFRIRSL
jgi:hypothetical protein